MVKYLAILAILFAAAVCAAGERSVQRSRSVHVERRGVIDRIQALRDARFHRQANVVLEFNAGHKAQGFRNHDRVVERVFVREYESPRLEIQREHRSELNFSDHCGTSEFRLNLDSGGCAAFFRSY